jgi:hypothetical protein
VDYWLGGKDNFQADREVGDQFANFYPDITVVARSSRAFEATRIVQRLMGALPAGSYLVTADGANVVDGPRRSPSGTPTRRCRTTCAAPSNCPPS